MNKRFWKLGAFVATFFATVTVFDAKAAVLQPTSSLTVGDKIFEVVSCTGNPCGQAEFTAVSGRPFGIVIQGTNGGGLVSGAEDLSVLFKVSVLNGAARIKDVELSFEVPDVEPAATTLNSTGQAVGENVLDASGAVLANLGVNLGSPFDRASFAPQSSIFLDKDIAANGGVITSVTQRISQIPVPGTLGLLLGALGCLAFSARRRAA